MAFLRRFCQMYPVFNSLDLATIMFLQNKVVSLASNPQTGGPLYLCTPVTGDRIAQLYPKAPGSHFVAFYGSQGYGGGYSNPPPHGEYSVIVIKHTKIQAVPITVTPRSNTSVYCLLPLVGSECPRGMEVCVVPLLLFVLPRLGAGLAKDRSSVQGILTNTCIYKQDSEVRKTGGLRPHWSLRPHKKKTVEIQGSQLFQLSGFLTILNQH
jgi:hypothetical protein